MYYVILFTGHMQQMPGVFLAHIRILQLYAQKRGDFTVARMTASMSG